MTLGIRSIDSPGEEGDGLAADAEGSPMRSPVDAIRSPGYDDCAGRREFAGEVAGEHLAVSGGRSGTDDRDSGRRREQPRVSAHPEHCRCMHPEVVEGTRPEVVSWQKQPSADVGGGADRVENAACIRPDHPPGSSLGETPLTDFRTRHRPSAHRKPEGCHRAPLRDERSGDSIPRLCKDRPRHSCQCLIHIVERPHLSHRHLRSRISCERFDHDRYPLLRNSARPTSSRPGLSTSARSAMVQASRRTLS